MSSTNPTNNNIIPWSKRHKNVTKSISGGAGLKYSLSNSFAQPLTMKELLDWSIERNDHQLIDEYNNHSLEYTSNGGSLDLRIEIAKLYDSPNITPNNILVTSGGQVALQLVNHALCHQGMNAITFIPGYQSVVEGPKLANAGSTTQIQLTPDNKWQIPISKVKEAIQPNTSYIVLNEPYNPAGTLNTKQTQSELIEIARKCNNNGGGGAHILCDEVYRLLEHDGPTTRLPAMADAYEKGISVVTMSKPWGGCGITIGWIALQDMELKEKLWNLQYFNTACMSRASEIQGIMVLKESNRILDRNIQIILHNKNLLQQFMNDYTDLFEWIPPTAGAICAIKFNGPLTSQQLGDQLAIEAGIGMKPAYCFTDTSDSVNIEPKNDYFRIGFGESKMPIALQALRDYVNQNKDLWRSKMKSS